MFNSRKLLRKNFIARGEAAKDKIKVRKRTTKEFTQQRDQLDTRIRTELESGPALGTRFFLYPCPPLLASAPPKPGRSISKGTEFLLLDFSRTGSDCPCPCQNPAVNP